jgi:dipeptidyl-peptidase 4
LLCDAKTIRQPKQTTKKPFEFNEVIPNAFGQRGFNGVWISPNEFTYSASGNFIKFNVITKQNETILTKAYIDQQLWSGPTFRFSPDLSKILVRYAQRQIFRHSTVSKFSIIFPGTNRPEFKIAEGREIQIAFFPPTGNGLAFIEENNIYYLNLETLELPKVVAGDGIPGVIYNGIPDWVYEEEVLGTDAASWFSPNGQKLAYIRFDDRQVKEAVYEMYGEGDRQYPEEIHLRYPKV